MGCGGSKDGVSTGSPDGSALQAYDRRQKISIRHGNEAKNLDTIPNIVFIFGGPGSRKGRVVDDLMTSYGFNFICGEEVIRTELVKRVRAAVKCETIQDVRNLLDSDPEHITVDFAVSAIERRMEYMMREHGAKVFIIDFLPNLRYLLKMNKLAEDCTESMQKFEAKYPISFALNLAVPPDKAIKEQAKAVPCTKPDPGKNDPNKDKPKGDEADSSRTKKRVDMYTATVDTYLNYFQKTNRLITVDVACGEADIIWNSVNKLMADLDFHAKRSINTVVVFTFGSDDINTDELERYDMGHIVLKDIVKDPMASVETVTGELSKHIDNNCKQTESFFIDINGTSLEPTDIEKRNKKPLTFAEMIEGYLEDFLPGSPKDFKPSSNSKRYKAVCSVENEIFLFPLDLDDLTCQRITAHIAAHRLIK